MDDADAIGRVLVLGSSGSGKSTLIHAWTHGAVPSRAPPRSALGASLGTLLLRSRGSGTATSALAFLEPDASPEHRTGRSIYYDRVDGVALVYESGSPSSWRAALDLYAEFAAHVVKRQAQWTSATSQGAGGGKGGGAPDAAAADWLRQLPLLLIAAKAPAASSVSAASGAAAGGRAATAAADALLGVCCCRGRGARPGPAFPPPIAAGSVTRLKIQVPLGRSGAVRPLVLDARVAGCTVSLTSAPGGRRHSGVWAPDGGEGGEGPDGLVAPTDVLSTFFAEVAAHRAVQEGGGGASV
jgi:hypothetical protein